MRPDELGRTSSLEINRLTKGNSGMTYKSIYTNFDQMQTLCGAL